MCREGFKAGTAKVYVPNRQCHIHLLLFSFNNYDSYRHIFFLREEKHTTMKKNLIPLILLAVSLAGFESCKKNDDAQTANVQIRLTDAPTALQEVNVDIQSVRVKFRDDENDSTKNWVDLTTRAGVYNLLNFQNGIDTLLATGTLPERQVKEIRLILGSNNTVKNNGVVFPLTIPSGSESGLKIKFSKALGADLNTLVVDFDAAQSVGQTGTGSYFLRPVIRVK